mmetsp:Transcript_19523/g.35334  ORF Transcript_19523/g.35334 Transcript_19523/m.35334 type:complete len:370 (-) Transcript_19523:357-1466(-)
MKKEVHARFRDGNLSIFDQQLGELHDCLPIFCDNRSVFQSLFVIGHGRLCSITIQVILEHRFSSGHTDNSIASSHFSFFGKAQTNPACMIRLEASTEKAIARSRWTGRHESVMEGGGVINFDRVVKGAGTRLTSLGRAHSTAARSRVTRSACITPSSTSGNNATTNDGICLRVGNNPAPAFHIGMIRTAVTLNDKHSLRIRLGNFHIRAETHVIPINIRGGQILAERLGSVGAGINIRIRGPWILDHGIGHLHDGLSRIARDAHGIIVVNDRDQRHGHPLPRAHCVDVTHHGGLGGCVGKIRNDAMLPVGVGFFGHEHISRFLAQFDFETPPRVVFGGVEGVASVGIAGLGVVLLIAPADTEPVHEVAR